MKPLERILKTIHCFLSAVRDLLTVCVICLILGAVGLGNMWLAILADVGVMILAVLNAIRALFVKKL